MSASFFAAMLFKGLPDDYKPLMAAITQSEKQQTFSEFKVALRSFEETERARIATAETQL